MRKYDCRSCILCRRARRLSPLIAACSSLASVGKVMALGCTVVSTVTRLRSLVRSAPASCATLKLSASRSFELVAEALPAMAQVGAFVRERMLEELLAGEVLEVRVVDPALRIPLHRTGRRCA